MRSAVIALAFIVGGCSAETVLRITVQPGVMPPPESLTVTLVGSGINAPPRTFSPVTFPGVIVVHGLPDAVSEVCVQAEGLDGSGAFLVGGSATVELVAHRTTLAEVQMSNAFVRCPELAQDLAATTPSNLAGVDLAQPTPDGGVAICPAGSIFCDDFESGDTSHWTSFSVKQDAGALAVQSTTKRHGTYALRALSNGAPGADTYSEVEKDFPATAPPFALRANVYFPQTLQHYDHLIALYENSSGSTNAFSIGGDNNAFWVVAENESMAGDFVSDMVPTGAGQWHCVELVIDAAGMVTLYVDNHRLVGPWQRTSAVSYSALLVGVTRSVDTDLTAFIDDVAVGPSRLYCPQ